MPKLQISPEDSLSLRAEDGDRGELLIHDTYRIFTEQGWPEVIKSGEMAEALNKIESSPWSEYSRAGGKFSVERSENRII